MRSHSTSTHRSRSLALLCLTALLNLSLSLSVCHGTPLPQLLGTGGGGMQGSPYEEIDPSALAAYGPSLLPVQSQQAQQQQQQQQGAPPARPASYMASVTLQQAGPGSGPGSDSDSGMGGDSYSPASLPGPGVGGSEGTQQAGDPFVLLKQAVDRAAAAIAAASSAAANAAAAEAGAGGGAGAGMGMGKGQGGDDGSGGPGGPQQGGDSESGAGAGPGEDAGAGGPPEATQKHKLVTWTDFSKGVTACGQQGDPAFNQGWYLAVDTALGAENVCGKHVLISTKDGKSAVGTVIDLGGTDGSIILSPALFSHFHDLDKGIFHATYTFL